MNDIRIGTSGFSYDDWRGYFYPEDIQKGEMLRYYADHFSSVEVNSSYYTIPPPTTFVRMAEKTPPGFEFVVKANKDLTHTPEVDLAVFKQFVSSVQPLTESGKLACILAQYPWSFKRSPQNADRLRQLREEFGDLPVVIEFRNFSWVCEETLSLLREHNLGFCCVDEPRLRGLMPRVAISTSPIGYVRFHGRNGDKWFQHEEAWERYDYLYTAQELQEWVPKIHQIASDTAKTYLFFNNHYKGKAIQNAKLFASMLNISLPTSGNEEK